jgi:uncharacterized membrane protein YjjP (DUF1212 family)
MTPPPGTGAPAPPPAPPTSDEVLFVLRLGRAVHTCGYAAHRVEEIMAQAASRLGLEGQFFTTPTSIFAAFGPDDRQRTYLLRVEPGDVHLERLNRLDAVLAGVREGRLAPDEGLAQIERIVHSEPRYGALLTTIAYGLASAASACILGADPRGIGVASAIGAAVALLGQLAGVRPALGRVFVPLAAFVAAILAAVAARLVGPFPVHIATLAGIIVLLPGLTLTLAMTEVSTNHLVSGTARLTGAVVTFITLGFGVAMGRQAAALVLGAAGAGTGLPLPPWTEWLAVLVAPLALTVLLRAQPRDAGWILGTGVLTFVGGRLGARALGPELGIFVGALTAGVASNVYGRLLARSPIVTLVPSILLLVPGSVGFRGLVALLDREVVNGVEAAFRTVLMVSALVAGLLIANVAVPPEPPARAPRGVRPRRA